MKCPFCGCEETQVKDSRNTDDNTSVRRRRECPECGSRFTTFERVQLRELVVVKKNGERTLFDRDKLAKSITLAVRKRPISAERVEKIVNSLQRRFESSGENEISTEQIGESVMDALSRLDNIAYIRFASVYKDFRNLQDLNDFVATIEKLATPQNEPEIKEDKND
ncbi:MAG: transcriptional repressor NrdR [Alphaproteobacteria bacterium]|jgi:transcriptional repressor NrdR|nr:transcriptional repressor NrdR [Alphaproteobacteria bacterium]